MRKAIIILFVFLFDNGLFAQDSSRFSIGASINYFPSNIADMISNSKYHAVYFHDLYAGGGWYPVGIHFKTGTTSIVNRFGTNFRTEHLYTNKAFKKYSQRYFSLYIGHEHFFKKKLKNMYVGSDFMIGQRKVKDPSSKITFLDKEAGILFLVGYKLKVSKHFALRTEFNLGVIKYQRYVPSHKSHFEVRCDRGLSFEMYYTF